MPRVLGWNRFTHHARTACAVSCHAVYYTTTTTVQFRLRSHYMLYLPYLYYCACLPLYRARVLHWFVPDSVQFTYSGTVLVGTCSGLFCDRFLTPATCCTCTLLYSTTIPYAALTCVAVHLSCLPWFRSAHLHLRFLPAHYVCLHTHLYAIYHMPPLHTHLCPCHPAPSARTRAVHCMRWTDFAPVVLFATVYAAPLPSRVRSPHTCCCVHGFRASYPYSAAMYCTALHRHRHHRVRRFCALRCAFAAWVWFSCCLPPLYTCCCLFWVVGSCLHCTLPACCRVLHAHTTWLPPCLPYLHHCRHAILHHPAHCTPATTPFYLIFLLSHCLHTPAHHAFTFCSIQVHTISSPILLPMHLFSLQDCLCSSHFPPHTTLPFGLGWLHYYNTAHSFIHTTYLPHHCLYISTYYHHIHSYFPSTIIEFSISTSTITTVSVLSPHYHMPHSLYYLPHHCLVQFLSTYLPFTGPSCFVGFALPTVTYTPHHYT